MYMLESASRNTGCDQVRAPSEDKASDRDLEYTGRDGSKPGV